MPRAQLESIDSVPIAADDFSSQFSSWLTVLVDSLNYTITQLQDVYATRYTSAQITALSPDWDNGIIVYDTDLDLYVGMQSGSLVQFTTAAYP